MRKLYNKLLRLKFNFFCSYFGIFFLTIIPIEIDIAFIVKLDQLNLKKIPVTLKKSEKFAYFVIKLLRLKFNFFCSYFGIFFLTIIPIEIDIAFIVKLDQLNLKKIPVTLKKSEKFAYFVIKLLRLNFRFQVSDLLRFLMVN